MKLGTIIRTTIQGTFRMNLRSALRTNLVRSVGAMKFGVAVCVLLAPALAAQPSSWTLRFADGELSVNGQVVSLKNLPSGLDARQEFLFSWTGDEAQVVQLGNVFYRVQRADVRQISPQELVDYGTPVVSLGESKLRNPNPSYANRQLVTQLNELAADIDGASQMEQAALKAGAVQAAQTAAVLPHLELQSYWYGVQQEDPKLYAGYIEEQQIFARTQQLAEAILLLPQSERRTGLENELHGLLSQFFDLKQENRKREIVLLENRLEELQRLLDQRYRKRDQMIEARFKELVGSRH